MYSPVRSFRGLSGQRGEQIPARKPVFTPPGTVGRRRARLAVAALLIGLIAATLALLPSLAGANGCTGDTWMNTAGGLWSNAANWSAGLPTSTSDVCITTAGSGNYTVMLTGSVTVKSLTLGSGSAGTTQTLAVQGTAASGNASLDLTNASSIAVGGDLVLDNQAGSNYALLEGATLTNGGTLQSQSEGATNNYLRASLTDTSGSSFTVASGELLQDQNTTITNGGTLDVSTGGALLDLDSSGDKLTNTSSVTDHGTITLSGGATYGQSGTGAETGNAVNISGGTLNDGGAAGAFHLLGGCTLAGTIPASQTVSVLGNASGGDATTTLQAGGVTNDGTLVLDNASGSNYALLEGATLTNDGTLQSQVEGSTNNYLRANVTNDTGAHVVVASGELLQDQNTATVNDGTLTIDTGGAGGLAGLLDLDSSGDTLTNNGTITETGTIALSGGSSFTQAASSQQTGNPVVVTGSALTDSATAGTGTFNLLGGSKLTGTIPSTETVTILGNAAGGDATTTLQGSGVTNDGTLVLDNATGSNYALLQGATLTNDGTLQSQVEGTTNNYLRANVTNDTGAHVVVASGELLQDQNTATVNDGTLTIDTGGAGGLAGLLDLDSSGDTLTNNGTITETGTIALSGGSSFTQAASSQQTGNPVVVTGSALTDSATAGTGTFNLLGGSKLTGTIPSTETVTILGNAAGGDATTTLQGSGVTNDGTLVLDNATGSNYALLQGATLTNDGTLQSQVEGTTNNYLRAPLTNESGGQTVVASGELRQDQNTATTNDGTLTVDAGALLNLDSSLDVLDNTGTVTNLGALSLSSSATWQQAVTAGSPQTGNPVALTGATLTDSAGGGAFQLLGGSRLSGTIPTGQTVTVLGNAAGGDASTTLNGGVTNDGTLVLDNASGSNFALLQGATLTNDGTLQSQVEGTSNDYLRVSVVNTAAATMVVVSGELRQDQNTTITNNGTLTVDATALLNLDSSLDVLDNSGTVSNLGTLSLSSGATWQQAVSTTGAQQTGNPVALTGATLTDSAGAGAFQLLGGSKLSGTIPTGQTVTVLGNAAGGDASTTLNGGVTNDGTLVLDNASGSNSALLQGATLTNDGTLQSQSEGIAGTLDYLRVTVANTSAGQITVASGTLQQDQSTATTNDGTITVDAGAFYNLTSSAASLTNETDGTLAFQIAGVASFGTIALNGNAKLTLAGGSASPILTGGYVPPLNTEFQVITGVTGSPGTFTTVLNNFAGDYSSATSISLKRIDPTATTLSAAPNPSAYGQTVTLTAIVAPDPGQTGNPTGMVTFSDGGVVLGIGTVATSNGTTSATFTSSAFAVGPHALAATYDGNDSFGASPSSTVADTVNRAAAAVSIAASTPAIAAGQSETLTATVTGPSGVSPPPTGQVTFTDGGTALASVALTSSGGAAAATLTTSSLAAGAHSLGASYSGDGNYAPASAASPAGVTVSAPPPAATTTTSTTTTTSARGGVAGVVVKPIPKDTRIVPHGTVRVRLPDSRRFIPISQAKTIPLGTTVDATDGRAQIDVATPSGPAVKGELYGGSFVLTESKSGTVIATLTGGNFAVCPANSAPRKTALLAQTAVKKASPSTVVRKLWANVKGNFTTSGRYASASVRGTQWLTEDRCDGTYVFVAFGAVRVTAFATHRSTLVKTKGSLLVKAP